MNSSSLSKRVQRAVLIGIVCLLAGMVTVTSAAYRLVRPIVAAPYGYINQYNLYGEGAIHKGIDFPASIDTTVYAVADGVVRDIKEDGDDGCSAQQCGDFGNYILVRHNRTHYDRANGQIAYVYSLGSFGVSRRCQI